MSIKKYILYMRWISVEILLTFRKVKVGKLIHRIDEMEFLGYDVHQKVIGICGLGRIGHGVAGRAKGFNIQVLYVDLVRALCVRKIARAGLDVYERELQIESALLQMKNVILTPRIASASRETNLHMSMMAAENLIAGLTGRRPPNLVNQEGGTSWSSGNKLQK